MTTKAEVATKSETKPDVRRRNDWFEFPDLLRWDFPDLSRWFDRPFANEMRMRVEEELRDGSVVIRAEIPGIDPEKDVEITVSDGVLRIAAERKKETKEEEEGRVRSEFRYGSFVRTVALPKGATEKDVKASYKDGILEVTVPVAAPAAEQKKIPVTRN